MTKKTITKAMASRILPRPSFWFGMFLAVTPLACKSNLFKGKTAPKPVQVEPGKLSPPETDVGQTVKPTPPPPPPAGKHIALELQPAPPESWWNNCVTVTYNGKSFDAGCSKVGGGLKLITIPVAEGESCAALTFEVKTYLNQGSECRTRVAAGQSCEGPYGATPDFTRVSSEEGAARYFQWLKAPERADTTLRFEDQTKENYDAALANPAEADAKYGVDFDDVVIRIVPKEVTVHVQQGKTAQTYAQAPAGCK
jgi:hypothetical protein